MIISLLLIFTGVNQVHLVPYNQFHLDQAYQLLALLTLDLLPSDQGQGPAVSAPDIDPIITDAIEIVPLVEGNVPPERGQLDAVPVGMDGACMFASFRRAIDAPLEYTSAHLRHQLIITICNHNEFFYPLLMESIKGTYGFPRMDSDEYQRLYDEGLLTDAQVDDHNTPGPYSFLGYLRALQKPDFWGNDLCLCLLSMCFQIGITVINAKNFTRIRFRHKRNITDSQHGAVPLQGSSLCPSLQVQPLLHLDRSFCTQMGDRCTWTNSLML